MIIATGTAAACAIRCSEGNYVRVETTSPPRAPRVRAPFSGCRCQPTAGWLLFLMLNDKSGTPNGRTVPPPVSSFLGHHA